MIDISKGLFADDIVVPCVRVVSREGFVGGISDFWANLQNKNKNNIYVLSKI
jgi:hypothetical protein